MRKATNPSAETLFSLKTRSLLIQKLRRVAVKYIKSAVAYSRHESVLDLRLPRKGKSAARMLQNVTQNLKKAGLCDQGN